MNIIINTDIGFGSGQTFHWIRNLYLRFKYGAGCCDIFSLDYYLAKRIIKPLKRFRECNNSSHPMDFKSLEEWQKCLDEMIWAFEFILKDEPATYYKNGKIDFRPYRREERGLKLFGKWFRNLWI